MIFAFLVKILLGAGLSSTAAKRFAPWLGGLVLVGLLVGGFFIWLAVHDHNVVEADRNAAEAQVAKTALDAERAANDADRARQAEIQANDATTRKAIDDAAAKDPEKARAAAGPASRAAADSLRRRKAGPHPAASRAR